MSFLRRLLGGDADPLAPLRRARRQKAWADLLARAEELDPARLDASGRSELESLVKEAGDALAEINLAEGEAFLRAGDRARAEEHFALALTQARSEEVRRRIPAAASAPPPSAPKESSRPHSSACGGCASSSCTSGSGAEDDLDEQVRLELILSSYPAALASRYLALSGPMRAGFLHAHAGENEEALRWFEKVDAAGRDDLFYFERGALLARCGRGGPAAADLERALALNPGHFPAAEALIELELSRGNVSSAEARLKKLLAVPEAAAFAHGRLCAIEAGRGNPEKALDHGLLAVSGGDPQVIGLTASLLEGAGRLAEAEALLVRLPSGGCGGGANLALADFWTRHGLHPDKALSAFQSALRHDPENPLILFRIAQIYSRRGWKKDASTLLEKLLALPTLEDPLAREVKDLYAACRASGTA